MIEVASLGECMVELAVQPDGTSAQLGFGGDTLNTAVYLARAGRAKLRVRYVTALGTDPFSQSMVAAWQLDGVDTSAVARLGDRLPGLYVIRTNDVGERSFHYWRESAAARSLLQDGRDVELAATLTGIDWLYVSAISIAILSVEDRDRLLALVDTLVRAGTKVAFDTNYRPRLWASESEAQHAINAMARRAAVCLPSADDDRALFGDVDSTHTARRWREFGVPEVVVKDGANACCLAFDDEVHQVPALSEVNVVDSTAAGDSFNAAYLCARMLGADPVDAAHAGHRLASDVVQYRGALIPRAGET